MALKRIKTKNQQEYDKELARINRLINKIAKEGLEVNKNLVPNRPKKITQKAINTLKNIKAEDIRKSTLPPVSEEVIREPKKITNDELLNRQGLSREEYQTSPVIGTNYEETIRTPIEKKESGIERQKIDPSITRKRRSEAAKNYWKRLKETDPQKYKERLDKLQEGLKKYRENKNYKNNNESDFKPPTDSTAPHTYDIIERVRAILENGWDLLMRMQREYRADKYLEPCFIVFERAVQTHDHEEYAQWLEGKEEDIADMVDTIVYASDQDVLATASRALQETLNFGDTPTLEELEALESHQEQFEGE